jgi:hypothetical protein
MRGNCPKCNASLAADELRVSPPTCPYCKTELQVIIRANWVYAAVSVAVASLIASLQGYKSIVFAFWVLVYGTIILGLIKFYRWELLLPIKIIAVPDYQLWPRDTA